METTISEIRSIVQRRRELEIEDQRLNQRFLELLELNQGARKSSRDTLSPKAGKAFFADVKRCIIRSSWVGSRLIQYPSGE